MTIGKDFFTKYWRAIAWTCGYILIMWTILHGLFNFNMFSIAHLTRLTHLELHGFAGLVFGLLILAAVPLYIATTVLTIRNQSVPIKIPMPKCFTPPPPEPAPVPEPVVTEQETLPELHAGVPHEMRESFMRARKNYGVRQMSVFNRPNGAPAVSKPSPEFIENKVTSSSNESGAFPIPADFDIDTPDTESDIPVFSDIDFDDNVSDSGATDTNVDLQSYLSDLGISSETSGNLIIAGNFAIAVHADDDFWVADDIDWFAAGRQKPSPIVELLRAHDNDGKTPIFLIEQNNIMDFEQNVQKWRDSGIVITTNRAELPDIINKPTNN